MIELALANAAIVITLTKASLFKKFREYLPETPVINLNKLFHCPYCLSHYTSLLLILIFSPPSSSFDFIIKTFALVTLTSIFSFLLIHYLNLLEK